VKKKVPAISLATVYKNIHLFVESGIFRKMSMHHGSVRVEMNTEEHHHMVCSRCKTITDIGEKELGMAPKRRRLTDGFLVERYAVDVKASARSASRLSSMQSQPSFLFRGDIRQRI
jgi:Fur family transcriptional regulator, peroxide stress response regulator